VKMATRIGVKKLSFMTMGGWLAGYVDQSRGIGGNRLSPI
jgi:hypothetical protein